MKTLVTVPKRFISIAACTLLLFTLGLTTQSKAQLGDVGTVIRSGADDANILFKEFLTPVGNGFGAGLNTGWNHMARPHRTLGFSLSIRGAFSMVPDDDLMFNLLESGLTNIEPAQAGVTSASTFAGPEQSTTLALYARDVDVPGQGTRDVKIEEFDMPGGIDFTYMPSAMIQLGIGVIKDTEIGLRYMPSFDVHKNVPQISLFGLNVKHGINQWIPGGGLLPVDISVQGGFTNFDISADFNVDPTPNENTTQESIDQYDASDWAGQGMSINANAWNINALVGKNIPFIGGYAGIGIEGSTFGVSANGNYPILVPAPTMDNPERNELDHIADPIDFDIEGTNNLRGIIGVQLSLGPLKINAEYTIATYSTINAGIAVSIR